MPKMLDPGEALKLARRLTTIGHPFQEAAIDATAGDLMDLCKGTIRNGRIVQPQEQAELLIQEIRQWDTGWPDRGGTRRLYDQFRSMFRTDLPENAFIDFDNEPCICESGRKFRNCCKGKAWDDGTADLDAFRKDLKVAEEKRKKVDTGGGETVQ